MKLKLALWSYSSFLKNKLYFSIKDNKKINIIGIYTRNKKNVLKNKFFKKIKVWTNSKKLLNNNLVDSVYLSCPNSLHFKYGKRILKSKKNLICEKPITLNFSNTKTLINLSKKNNVFLYENFLYLYHPLFQKIKNLLLNKKIGKVHLVHAKFTIPLSDKNDIRFVKNLGGGALFDLGTYPISLESFLFENKNIKIVQSYSHKNSSKIDTYGSIILKSTNMTSLYQWGFNLPYQNSLEIFGTSGSLFCSPFFSKHKSQKIILHLNKKNNLSSSIKIKPSDQVYNAFNYYIKNKNNKLNKLHLKKVLNHSKLISLIRNA